MLFQILVALAAIASCVTANSVKNDEFVVDIVDSFHNPVLDFVSPDPQILYLNGFYYMVLSSNKWPYVNGGILVYKSKTLTDFRASPVKMVYHVPQGMSNLWAPELHLIRGNLYIYFAMDDGNNDYHRMYVIKAYDSTDPLGEWGPAKRFYKLNIEIDLNLFCTFAIIELTYVDCTYTQDDIDYWAIDGTVLEYSAKLYFIWSGWPDVNVGSPQNLYIAEMCDPETICSKRALLREPKFDWEGPHTLEGPYILQKAGRVFLVFSAHSTWGPDYYLGIMGLDNNQDAMVPNSWWHNNDGCVFYRNDDQNGGLRGVLWTDVLQTTVMLVSLAVISIKGVIDVGGIDVVWERAKDGNRVEFFNFDPDPRKQVRCCKGVVYLIRSSLRMFRTRHTFFTCLIAGYFFWIPSFAATQLQVQRVLSMPTLSRARKALAINFVGLLIIVGFCFFTGVVVYAMFYDCDPITSEIVEKSDQIVPLFAARVSNGIPGILGLFISSLTCASMTSLSSGLNALASITTFDYVNKLYPNLSDFKLSLISKINTFVLGMVSYAFVFAVENMGSILPATSSLLGIMLGPTFGIFTLGMMFPWANAKGSLLGMITAFILMIAYVIGNLSADGLPDQRRFLDTFGCDLANNTIHSTITSTSWKDEEYSGMTKLLSASYMWYSAMGCVLCVVFGLVFSIAFNNWDKGSRKLVNGKCISPPILTLLNRVAPNHIQQWVDQSETLPKAE